MCSSARRTKAEARAARGVLTSGRVRHRLSRAWWDGVGRGGVRWVETRVRTTVGRAPSSTRFYEFYPIHTAELK